MTKTEYEKQNALGYEGDRFIGEEIAKLVKEHGIEQIIETGTYLGNTTKKLVLMAPTLSIEINVENWRRAKINCEGIKGIDLLFGNSIDMLKEYLPLYTDKKLLFFLDAHWGEYCPLLDELELIANHGIKPVIVIHDFKVPKRPELGFDSYNGQPFELEWIEKSLEKIYGSNFAYHYNLQAEGAKRGVIYVYPN